MAKKVKKPVSKKSVKKSVSKKVKKTSVKPKKKKVLAIPKGYNSVTPYLIIDNAKSAIDFYIKAFGAKETIRLNAPNGKVVHAELKIGDSKIMLADECHEMNALSPKAYKGCAVSIHLYVKDVDSVAKKASQAGAKLIRSPENMFYGDRSATLEDPFGHKWTVSTHVEDVTPAQTRKRAEAMFNNKQLEPA